MKSSNQRHMAFVRNAHSLHTGGTRAVGMDHVEAHGVHAGQVMQIQRGNARFPVGTGHGQRQKVQYFKRMPAAKSVLNHRGDHGNVVSPLGKRARSQLKQETLDDLMPRAFVKPSRTNAMIDLEAGFLAVDTASVKAAEAVVSKLREALGSFPALPLQAAQPPRAVLGQCLLGDGLPADWFLGEECELVDPAEKGAIVKCLRHDLASEEVLAHLQAGKQVSRLAIVADGHLSCVIGDDLVLRKLKLLEGAVDGIENGNTESLEYELMVRFTLFSAELGRFHARFAQLFGLQGGLAKAA